MSVGVKTAQRVVQGLHQGRSRGVRRGQGGGGRNVRRAAAICAGEIPEGTEKAAGFA